MAWIDYQKAHNIIPHRCISECLEVFGNSKNKWKLELTSNGVPLGNVEVRRSIFQVYSLSPLLFVLCMIPLSLILRKVKFHYEFGDKKTRLNHLLFMNDLKLFAKSNNQLNSLLNRVYKQFSEGVEIEFGIKKCRVLVLKRGKVDKAKSRGFNLVNGKLMKMIDVEEFYKMIT